MEVCVMGRSLDKCVNGWVQDECILITFQHNRKPVHICVGPDDKRTERQQEAVI